jgi:2,5-diamino-6-(ribosylamino)-4(3H)-pyrimidinone 5'-phosphate reductase
MKMVRLPSYPFPRRRPVLDLSAVKGVDRRDLLTTGRIAPGCMPDLLARLQLKSVMIEGGSRILSSFLHAPPRPDGSPLVDNVVVTVAPMFIGEGVDVVPAVSCALESVEELNWLIGRPRRRRCPS